MTDPARRQFVVFTSAVALASSLVVVAQPAKPWRIGFLTSDSRQSFVGSGRYAAFLLGMQQLGYVEGRDFVVEGRFVDKSELLTDLAVDLVRRRVAVIVVAGTDAARAAQRATTVIPIVLATAADPIASGFVASLARPGGNITGNSMMTTDLGPKQLEILKVASPKISRVGIFLNPLNSSHTVVLQGVLAAAQRAGTTIVPVDARGPQEIERGFVTMSREGVEAVIVPTDITFFTQRQLIAELANTHRMASVFAYREPVLAGGLLSYGPSLMDFYRRAATFVDKILKGARPADIPVEQPTKLELVVNLKTAKLLDITIPQSLLLSADEIVK